MKNIAYLCSILLYYICPLPWTKVLPATFLYFQTENPIFGWAAIGDILIEADFLFTLALLSFGVSHYHIIEYLSSQRRNYLNQNFPWKMFLIFGTISFSLLALYPIFHYFTIPIVLYALLLSWSVTESIVWLRTYTSKNRRFSCGCLLFVISDLIILLELIAKHYGINMFKIGLPLYWIALSCIYSDVKEYH